MICSRCPREYVDNTGSDPCHHDIAIRACIGQYWPCARYPCARYPCARYPSSCKSYPLELFCALKEISPEVFVPTGVLNRPLYYLVVVSPANAEACHCKKYLSMFCSFFLLSVTSCALLRPAKVSCKHKWTRYGLSGLSGLSFRPT